MKQLSRKVSIVIVCMNRPDNLYPCLDSIQKNTTTDYETFVVAYLYDKAKLAEARARYPRVNFLESDDVRGFAENNNLALRQVRGAYCFILNADTEFATAASGAPVASQAKAVNAPACDPIRNPLT